jgi:hypothetical protein
VERTVSKRTTIVKGKPKQNHNGSNLILKRLKTGKGGTDRERGA